MKPWAVSLHILCCPWISMYILWQITLSCWTINEYWFKCPFIQGVANAFACTWIRNHWCICCCHCFNLLKIRIAWSKWVGFILTQSFLPNCCFLSISVSCILYLTLHFNGRSSISDSGIGMICNVFPNTLSRLLLALCPNITSSNLQVLALIYGLFFFFGSICFMLINMLIGSLRWNSVCHSTATSPWAHGLWNVNMWSHFWRFKLWWNLWLWVTESL